MSVSSSRGSSSFISSAILNPDPHSLLPQSRLVHLRLVPLEYLLAGIWCELHCEEIVSLGYPERRDEYRGARDGDSRGQFWRELNSRLDLEADYAPERVEHAPSLRDVRAQRAGHANESVSDEHEPDIYRRHRRTGPKRSAEPCPEEDDRSPEHRSVCSEQYLVPDYPGLEKLVHWP